MTPRRGPLVVVGDTLLDRDVAGVVERLCPDAPAPVLDELEQTSRPGGAGLAAALAAADGREVVLVTALSGDDAGSDLARLLEQAGVRVVDIGLHGPTPQKIRLRTGDRCLLRVDRDCATIAATGAGGTRAEDALGAAGTVLVSDYGRGVVTAPSVRAALARRPAGVPVVWDPHPRGTPPLGGCRLVTPNGREAEAFAPEVSESGLAGTAARARTLRQRWSASAVAVTMGAQGALVASDDGPPLVSPAPKVSGGDTCGAGDRFAAAAAALLSDGAVVCEAVTGAVQAASAFVAAGGAGAFRAASATAPFDAPGGSSPSPAPSPTLGSKDAAGVLDLVRGSGGVVVATGGCFDVLHAGHVALLEGARALGDCLVVCLNSDASVRRLKGPGRPRTSEADRARILLSLRCVDAVVVFDEETPAAVLDRVRPDVFVKGGDYAGADLPEAAVLAAWGGQAVVVPYLAGRSSTRVLEGVVGREP